MGDSPGGKKCQEIVASRNEALRGSGFPSRAGHGSGVGGARHCNRRKEEEKAGRGRAVDLAGETKPLLWGVPDFFMKYEVAHPLRVRRKRVEVVQSAGVLRRAGR